MPAGPIGSCWAPGSWSDTAWAVGTWANAVVVTPQQTTGGSRHTPPPRPRLIPPIELYGAADLAALEIHAALRITPQPITLALRRELAAVTGRGTVDPDPIQTTVTLEFVTVRSRGFSLVVPKAPKGVQAKQWYRDILQAWTGKEH